METSFFLSNSITFQFNDMANYISVLISLRSDDCVQTKRARLTKYFLLFCMRPTFVSYINLPYDIGPAGSAICG